VQSRFHRESKRTPNDRVRLGMGCQNDGAKLCRGLPFAPLGGDWAAAPMKRQPRSRGSALSIADTRWHWFAQPQRVPILIAP
jgi:hypothetical protein